VAVAASLSTTTFSPTARKPDSACGMRWPIGMNSRRKPNGRLGVVGQKGRGEKPSERSHSSKSRGWSLSFPSIGRCFQLIGTVLSPTHPCPHRRRLPNLPRCLGLEMSASTPVGTVMWRWSMYALHMILTQCLMHIYYQGPSPGPSSAFKEPSPEIEVTWVGVCVPDESPSRTKSFPPPRALLLA
jgi:hypothetical protein